MEVGLQSRATALAYHEIADLRKSMADLDRASQPVLDLFRRKAVPFSNVSGILEDLERIDWLGL